MLVDPPVPGMQLGDRYDVVSVSGEAPGYVEVRALDREVDVEVALWWMRPELFADPHRRDALIGGGVELRALSDVSLRACYGVGRGIGGLWVTWQLATGPALIPDTHGSPRPLEGVRRWLESTARALGVLHEQGLAHGRLVPQDVVSVGGVLKLGGGGIWRDVDPVAALRCWSERACDHYLAPEIRRYQAPTPAADVWSLATIGLELIAGVPGSQPDCARAAARRHPSLAALLVGALQPDPGRRPSLAELYEAAGNAAEAPYLDAQPRGKAAKQQDEKSTLLGHASGAAAAPRTGALPAQRGPTGAVPAQRLPTGAQTVIGAQGAERASSAPARTGPSRPPPIAGSRAPGATRPPPMTPASPMRTQPGVPPAAPGVPPRPGAFHPEPVSFGLPTPPAAPQAPRVTAPVVKVGSGPVMAPPPAPGAPPPTALPTPARVAIAGAIERARTAPPGEFRVAAVSMKDPTGPNPAIPAPVLPQEPTGETPAVPKAKVRAIADVAGGRTFSVAPGQLGYLAPPKAVTDARKKKSRIWILVLIAILAAAAGTTLALLL